MSHPPLATGGVRPTPGAQLQRREIFVPDTERGRTNPTLLGRGADQARLEGASAPAR
jgi:hypothetical protein